MSDIERIAMCTNPHGLHEHVPLRPDEPMPTTCFADCDCTPAEFVRADDYRAAIAEAAMLRRIVASTHDYLLLAPDDSVYYEGLLARVRDALGYDK